MRKTDDAIAAWESALKADGEFRAKDETLLGLAMAHAAEGRDAKAEPALERLLREHPKSPLAPRAHLLLGTLLEKAERFDVAEYHYRMASEKNPDPEVARKVEFRRIGLLQRQGRNDEAAGVLDRRLEAGDRDLPAALLDWAARWQASQAAWPEALRASRALMAVDTEGPWKAIGGAIAGRSLEALGRADEARAAYAIAVAGGLPTRDVREAALALGRLAEAAKDLDAAQDAYARLAEAASADDELSLRAAATAGLGRVMEARGNDDAASRYFLGVAVLYDDPDLVPDAMRRAAAALGRLGRDAERKAILDELAQRYPDAKGAGP